MLPRIEKGTRLELTARGARTLYKLSPRGLLARLRQALCRHRGKGWSGYQLERGKSLVLVTCRACGYSVLTRRLIETIAKRFAKCEGTTEDNEVRRATTRSDKAL